MIKCYTVNSKIDKPVFSDKIHALNGKEVTVKGFIIPVEGYKSHKEFIFSAFPYSMCFFCGGAGPESVMEVESVEPVEYTTESITLRGKLKLNTDDVNKLMYALTEARLVKKKYGFYHINSSDQIPSSLVTFTT